MSKIQTSNINNKLQQRNKYDQDQPITPKKKPHHRQISSTPTNRLKFRYTIIQKPHTSKFAYLICFIWMLMSIAIAYNSYQQKIKIFQNNSAEQWIKCKQDYLKNKCEKGLKATIKYCQEKKRCFEGTVQDIFQQKVKISFIIGEILKDFVEGIGLVVTGVMIILFWLFSRRNGGKEVKKQYIQYYN